MFIQHLYNKNSTLKYQIDFCNILFPNTFCLILIINKQLEHGHHK